VHLRCSCSEKTESFNCEGSPRSVSIKAYESVHRNPATTSKKQQRSEQPETSNPSKKAFEDLSMEEFLAGDDGAECQSLPSPTKNIVDNDVAICEMFHQSPPREVPKPAGKGKFKNKK